MKNQSYGRKVHKHTEGSGRVDELVWLRQKLI